MARVSEEERRALPPYIPFKSFLGLIDRLQQTAIPSRIDVSLLRNYSGSVGRQLIAALKFLGLIEDGGAVTARLKQVVKAYGTPEWKEAIGDTIITAYLEVMRGVEDIDAMTPAQLDGVFRNYGADGDVLRKCVSFWIAGMLSAGYSVSPHILNKPRAKAERGRRPRRNSRPQAESEEQGRDRGNGDTIDVMLPPLGTVRFTVPIPDKNPASMLLPPDLTVEDWDMVSTMVKAYIARRNKAGA